MKSRRDFLKTSSLGALGGLVAAGERLPLLNQDPSPRPPRDETITCALIGFGVWGREIAVTLGRVENARLHTVCDTYGVMLRRARRSIPDIETTSDYREVLDNPNIDAVLVATPSHLHREIVVDALTAGKHVYCEAPLASSMEDAAAIARTGRDASSLIFQAGLLYRTEPQYRSVFQFIRSGALGKTVMARAQWHTRNSWRRTSPDSDRNRAQNWRIDRALSLGLVGEMGIQQIDTADWIIGALPLAVSGFGRVMYWKDGRDVADTVQTVLEYPGGVNMIFDATLVSGFDAMYDTFYGSDSTIMLRDSKAWMFKEVDAPMLGWEVYARTDKFYKESGIALLANATKLDALGQNATSVDPNAETPLFHALTAFVENYFFGPYEPVINFQRAYEANVVAVAASQAIRERTRIEISPDSFVL